MDSEKNKAKTPMNIELSFKDKEIVILLNKILNSLESSPWKQTIAIILSALSNAIAIGSIAFTSHSDLKDRQEARILQQENFVISELKQQRQQKIDRRNLFNGAATRLRRDIHKELIACKLGLRNTPEAIYKFQAMRLNARMETVETTYGMESIFKDDQNIRKIALKLTKFDFNIKDVCAKNAPSEDKWWSYQKDAANLMSQSIEYSDTLIKKESTLEKSNQAST